MPFSRGSSSFVRQKQPTAVADYVSIIYNVKTRKQTHSSFSGRNAWMKAGCKCRSSSICWNCWINPVIKADRVPSIKLEHYERAHCKHVPKLDVWQLASYCGRSAHNGIIINVSCCFSIAVLSLSQYNYLEVISQEIDWVLPSKGTCLKPRDLNYVLRHKACVCVLDLKYCLSFMVYITSSSFRVFLLQVWSRCKQYHVIDIASFKWVARCWPSPVSRQEFHRAHAEIKTGL